MLILTKGVVEFVSAEDGCDDPGDDGAERGDGDSHHAGDREEHGEGVVTEKIGDNDVTDTESLLIT